MARPNKIVWPIGFEEMLRYALPQKRPEDRPRFYRLYLRDFLHKGSTIKASEDEIEKACSAARSKTFTENEAFHIRLHMGMSMEGWKRESNQMRGRIRASRRWSKEN
jgi:hypothetical protein